MEEFVNAMEGNLNHRKISISRLQQRASSLYSNLFYVNFFGLGPAGGLVVLFNSLDL